MGNNQNNKIGGATKEKARDLPTLMTKILTIMETSPYKSDPRFPPNI